MTDRAVNRCWALGTVTLVVLLASWPAVASAATSWRTSLVREDAVAALNTHGLSSLSISLFTGGTNGDDIALDASLYPKVTTRGELENIYVGQGPSSQPLSSTGSFPLNCRVRGVAHFSLSLGEGQATAAPTCGGALPYLSLNCRPATCDGVYPLALRMTNGSQFSTIWTLVSITSPRERTPLALCWTFDTDPVTRRIAVAETKALREIAHFNSVPLTIAANYNGISKVTFSTASSSADFRDALARAVSSTHHDLVNAPPTSVDFGSMAAHGLLADVANETHMATNLIGQFVVKAPSKPLILSGAIAPADVIALNKVGTHQIVVPDDSLTLAPSTTLSWGTPFYLSHVSVPVLALSTDAGLRRLVQDRRIAPGLRSALVLGTLSLLHYEAPFTPAVRTTVINSPLSTLSPRFLADVLGALRHDPLVSLRSLSSSIVTSTVGANGYPFVRELHSGPAPSWSSANVRDVAALDASLRSYAESVSSLVPVVPLEVRRLLAERRATSATRAFLVDSAEGTLKTRLSAFSINNTTITLTGTGAALPITITSRANYAVHGFLSLSAPNVQFPQGSVIPVTLSASTTSVRVPANIIGPGNITLIVTFESVDRQLTFAHGAIQVRSTATSFLGVVLSFGSLFVIGAWWWRTTRRTSKGRHAA